MQTRISTKGQVVLPGAIRRTLGLQPGDPLEAKVERGRIILIPRKTRAKKVTILVDPVTGLPVLGAGPDAPPLSSRQVDEILSTFP